MRVQLWRRGYDPASAHLQPGLYLHRLAQGLAGRGHEASVSDPGTLAGGPSRPEAAVWCLGPTSFLRDRVHRVRASAQRVVAFVPGPLYSGNELRRNLGRLLWTHARDHAVHVAMASASLRTFVRRLQAACDQVAVPTRRLQDQLVAAGAERHRITLVPCGLDATGKDGSQGPDADAWLAAHGVGGPFAVNFGPIRPVRGVDTLVQAAPDVEDLEILVLARAGDGRPAHDRAWLEKRIGRLPPEAARRVHLHQESLPRPLLQALVGRARVAAFPLRLVQSVQPAAVHEAFQLGVPAALSDVAPLAELAEGAHARTFPVGDPAALAETLQALHRDHARAHQACSAWARRQPTWDEVAVRFEGILA